MRVLWITIRLVILVAGCLIFLSVAATAQIVPEYGAVQPRSTEALLSHSVQGQHPTFRFIPIDCPGALSTRAMGINVQGTIVGSLDDSVATHAFLLRDAKFTAFDVPGATLTCAKGINAREEIIGFFLDVDFNLHGFKTIDIPFSIKTRAESINDARVISRGEDATISN
jgi:hypothetical protein